MENTAKTQVQFSKIERETEKAALITFPVSWNMNIHFKSIWIPKKCIEFWNDKIENSTCFIATWLLEKLESENKFHDYWMRFQTIHE